MEKFSCAKVRTNKVENKTIDIGFRFMVVNFKFSRVTGDLLGGISTGKIFFPKRQ